MSYNSGPSNNQNPHIPSTRRITLKLEYIKPKELFEQYYYFYSKPEEFPLEEHSTRYIRKNKRKETIESLEISLKKLKTKLEEELFPLALRYESRNKETLNIYNCYKNKEYCEITEIIKGIILTLNYPDSLYQTEEQKLKEKQERLQTTYIKNLGELYEKQTGIWINDKYCIVETFKELKEHHEQYWERRVT